MRLSLTLIACVLLAAPSSALAADIRLAWNNCDGAGGLHEIAFDCNTNSNTQAHTLVASFTAPPGITAYISNQATILVRPQTAVLPDWWQMNASGQCRSIGGAVASADFTTGPFGCTDVWGGLASAGFGFTNVVDQRPGWARMVVGAGSSIGNTVPLIEGQEYYAFKVVILNNKTVGTGSCAGCSTPVALVLQDILVVQPSGTPGGNVDLGTRPGEISDRSVAGWQCPAAVQVYCGDTHIGCYVSDLAPTCSTPTQRSTWGMIKAIYH